MKDILMRRSALGGLGIAAAIGLGAGIPAAAQELDGEIVVTAQKREQALNDVGIAITALSGETTRELGFTNATDIAAQVPGLVFDSTNTGPSIFLPSIRGVTQNDFGLQQEPPNAIYVDNVYISSMGAAGFGLFDVSRIEVLKGPQGTLFGRNATGGLIHVITNKPTEEFEGYVDLQAFGQNGFGYRAESALSGALTEGVRGRVAGYFQAQDAFWKNNLAGAEDTFEVKGDWAVRGQLEADLTDAITAGVTVTGGRFAPSNQGTYVFRPAAKDPATGLGYVLTPENDPGAVNGVCSGCDFFGQDGSDSHPFNSSFNDVGTLKKKFLSVTGNFDWDMNFATLTSITNYQKFDHFYREDCDGTAIDFCRFAFGQDLEQWSQELRLSGDAGSTNWQLGFYYLNIDQGGLQIFQSTEFVFATLDDLRQKTESWAVFGQTEFMLSDKFRLTIGGRWTEDRKSIDSDVYGDFILGASSDFEDIARPEFFIGNYSESISEGDWAGRVALDYLPNDDLLIYASVNRGIKGGGFVANPNGVELGSDDRRFGSETLLAYEVGFKASRLFGSRTNLNAATYYYDYKDHQSFDFVGIASFVRNRPAKLGGIEAELSSRLAEGLDLTLGGHFQFKNKVENVALPSGDIVDRQSPKSPKLKLNGTLRKEWPLANGGSVAVIGSFDYSSKSWASVSNAPAVRLPSYFMGDARITYYSPDKRWEAALFVDNIGNDKVVNYAFDIASFGLQGLAYKPPRKIGAQFRYNF